jgi:hypothetical protein
LLRKLGFLTRFAELVAAHTLMNIDPSKFIGGYQEGFEAGVVKEREECAKMFEPVHIDRSTPLVHFSLQDTAKIIRARGRA